jgi:hypothetical protein
MLKNLEDMQIYGTDNVDATMKVWGQLSKGLQAITAETADYSWKSCAEGSAVFQKLLGTKSLKNAIEIQTAYAKTAYEGFVAQVTRIGEFYVNLAKETSKPFEHFVIQTAPAKPTENFVTQTPPAEPTKNLVAQAPAAHPTENLVPQAPAAELTENLVPQTPTVEPTQDFVVGKPTENFVPQAPIPKAPTTKAPITKSRPRSNPVPTSTDSPTATRS